MKNYHVILLLSVSMLTVGCKSSNKGEQDLNAEGNCNDWKRQELKGCVKQYDKTVYKLEYSELVSSYIDEDGEVVDCDVQPGTIICDTTTITQNKITFDKFGFISEAVNTTKCENVSTVVRIKNNNRTDSVMTSVAQTTMYRNDEEITLVMSEISTYYDKNGNMTLQKQISDEGTSITKNTYNIDGLLVSSSMMYNNYPVFSIKYTYDEQSRQKTFTVSDDNGEKNIGKWFYDENSVITKQVLGEKVDYHYEYKYIYFEYDKNGNAVRQQEKIVVSSEKININLLFSGEWQKILAQVDQLREDDTFVELRDGLVETVYDKYGNITDQKEFVGGKLVQHTVCEISYY